MGTSPSAHPPTPAVAEYMSRIADAAEKELGGAGGDAGAQSPPLLVAHFYTRYLADLFGGSMVGVSTSLLPLYPYPPRCRVMVQPTAAAPWTPVTFPTSHSRQFFWFSFLFKTNG